MRGGVFGVAEPEGLHEHGVVDGGAGQGGLLDGAQGRYPVVEVRNEDVAIFILHAGEELGEHHGGVGRPVAVVSAVEAVMGPVEGDGDMGVAARAEDDGLRAGLVDGAVADEEDVAVDEVGVGGENLLEVGGAGFFFSFPHKADVGVEGDVGGAESINDGELGEDGGFIVAGAAGVNALLAVDGAEGGREGRWDVPLGGGDGLAVVVGVEDDGVLGAWGVDVGADDGWRVGEGEELGFDVALAELGEEVVGVAAEAFGSGGYVGDGEEVGELVDEVFAMGGGPGVGGRCWCGSLGECSNLGEGEGDKGGREERDGARHGDTINSCEGRPEGGDISQLFKVD